MDDYISRKAAIAYIREQSEECQKAFEELGGESGIYADAYNDLAEDFYSIPAADVAPVVHGRIVGSLEDGRYRRRFSCCGEDATMITQWTWPKYCPHCGAKMDGGDDHEAD